MRFRLVIVSGLALLLLLVAGLADRALVGEASAARTAATLRIDTDAREMAASVAQALSQLEQAVIAGNVPDGVVVEHLALPPPRSTLRRGRPYGRRSRAELADLLRSTAATPTGLPEAVVARLLLGPAAAVTGVAAPPPVEERLLAGELPVRPEDLPFLARRLGVADDARVAQLAARIRRVPDGSNLPAPPAFLRRAADGGRVEGWARLPAQRQVVRYETTLLGVLDRTPRSERAIVGLNAGESKTSAPDALARVVAVAEVPGLSVRVTPRLPDPLRLTALRVILWLSALVGVAGLFGLRRALAREARAMARERAFLAGVTHELRTPVTAIRVLGETLAEGRGEPREYGTLVAQEGQRLEGLVERVLTMTRLEQAPRCEAVQPAELLRSAVALMRPRADRRGTEIEYRISDNLPTCSWDPEAVRRALLNVIENAIVHGRQNGHIEAAASMAGDLILLAIADDGPGIARADRSRVFGRFERATTDSPGTGLGLFLVDQVARVHGGRVDLETAAGRGATFTLVLPTRHERLPPEAKP